MEEIEIYDKIRNRYSPRAFNKTVPDEAIILKLFEASRWAASSRNIQPWRFIYATRDQVETWDKLFDCLTDSNQIWVKEAPLLILAFVKTIEPESQRKISKAEYCLGLAIGNLTAQANEMGINLRNMAGFSDEKARLNFNMPEHFLPVVMIAAGYPDNDSHLENEFKVPRGIERQRRKLDQLIYKGDWSIME